MWKAFEKTSRKITPNLDWQITNYLTATRLDHLRKEIDMRCQKCNGKMTVEKFYDYLDNSEQFYFRGWRCFCCGNTVDPIIQINRKVKPFSKVSRKRKSSIAVINLKSEF
jgi:hypothetical protein